MARPCRIRSWRAAGPPCGGGGAPEHSLCRIPKVECSAPPPRFPNSVDRRSAQRAWRLPGISAPLLGRAADLRGDSARHVRGRAARVRLHATVPLRPPGLPQCSAPLPAAAVHAFPFAACDGTRRLPSPGISIPPSLESISFPPATSFRPFLRFFPPMQRGGGQKQALADPCRETGLCAHGRGNAPRLCRAASGRSAKKYFLCPDAFEVRNPESPAARRPGHALQDPPRRSKAHEAKRRAQRGPNRRRPRESARPS